MPKQEYSPLIPPLTSCFIILAGWWLVTALGLVNPLFLPSPFQVGSAGLKLLADRSAYADTIATVARALTGVLLSVLVGVPLGLYLGRRPGLYRFFELPIDFFRSTPSSVLFFLFILLFGIGDAAKVAVVFYGCSLIMLVSSVYGTKPTTEKVERLRMVESLGATESQKLFLVVLPDATPHILAGLRLCVSLSLVLVVVTEMFLSSSSGLGRRVYDNYLSYRVPEMYSGILLLGLTGYLLNRAAASLEQRISFWQPNSQ